MIGRRPGPHRPGCHPEEWLTDAGAIILALVTMRLAARPAQGGYTYGLKRAEILSAQANGLTLLLLSAWLAYEAIRRLIVPPHVAGAVVLITAITGVAIRLALGLLVVLLGRVHVDTGRAPAAGGPGHPGGQCGGAGGGHRPRGAEVTSPPGSPTT